MDNTASILEMAHGAITEQFDIRAAEIMQNIADPNTPAAKKRQVVLTVDFSPNADRTQVVVHVTAKAKPVPSNPVQTTLSLGMDARGNIMAAEMVPNVPGQLGLDGSEQESPKILRIPQAM